MELIPAIDIRGGRCVRLRQGDYGRETVFDDDPLAVAERWIAQGALGLHVVDLDAARDGRSANGDVIRAIAQSGQAAVQVAGGVRDETAIRRWLEAGAARVVIGTMAIEQPDALASALRAIPADAIAVALDLRGGRPAGRGWRSTSERSLDDVVRSCIDAGARHFIYTDIARDGLMQHPDFDALHRVREVFERTGAVFTLAFGGGVTTVEDIVALDEDRLDAVILGRALYEGAFTLEDALRALATGDGT